VEDTGVVTKGATVPGWFQPDYGICNRQRAEEEHDEEEPEVKVVGS